MPPKRKYYRRKSAASTYKRKNFGAYVRTMGPSSYSIKTRRRAVARGKMTTVKRAQSKLGTLYNPMRSVGKDAIDYLHMLAQPSQAPTVRAPFCSQPTAVASSRLRGAFTSVAKNGTASVGPAFAGWLRVMPALNWYDNSFNTDYVVATGVAWNNVGKVQNVTAWEGASTATGARAVGIQNDTIFTAAKAGWGTYRPIACSVRVWNTSAVDSRNGTIYYGRTNLPLQVETTGPDAYMESNNSALPNNNNHYVALNGTTIDLVDGTTRRFTNSFNARIDGDDMYPVPATMDVHNIELSWRTMGPDDFQFVNIHSSAAQSATGYRHNLTKFYQNQALDILVSGTTAQSFDYEVVTHYEFVPNELISRIVQTAHGVVNDAEVQRAREAVNLGAHGAQNAPETIDVDMRSASYIAAARAQRNQAAPGPARQ